MGLAPSTWHNNHFEDLYLDMDRIGYVIPMAIATSATSQQENFDTASKGDSDPQHTFLPNHRTLTHSTQVYGI